MVTFVLIFKVYLFSSSLYALHLSKNYYNMFTLGFVTCIIALLSELFRLFLDVDLDEQNPVLWLDTQVAGGCLVVRYLIRHSNRCLWCQSISPGRVVQRPERIVRMGSKIK